jgi:hypothetical protein
LNPNQKAFVDHRGSRPENGVARPAINQSNETWKISEIRTSASGGGNSPALPPRHRGQRQPQGHREIGPRHRAARGDQPFGECGSRLQLPGHVASGTTGIMLAVEYLQIH